MPILTLVMSDTDEVDGVMTNVRHYAKCGKPVKGHQGTRGAKCGETAAAAGDENAIAVDRMDNQDKEPEVVVTADV
jgi:hypothetical protein